MSQRITDTKHRLLEPFRVTIQREETFEEVNAYSLNWANVLAVGLAVVTGIALLTFFLTALTPLRWLLPDFGTFEERSEVVRLNRQLRELEQQVAAQQASTMNLQRVLTGDVTAYDEAAAREEIIDSADLEEEQVERIPEDEQLRRSVASSRARYAANLGEGDIPLDQLDLVAPVDGRVSSFFDAADRHFGIDIVAPSNTPIKAAFDGHVVAAEWTLETGNVIAVQHAGNLLTFYKHNDKLLKRVGDFVRTGEAIAIIGNSGTRTDGPHLHFEIWHRGQPIDPASFIRFD